MVAFSSLLSQSMLDSFRRALEELADGFKDILPETLRGTSILCVPRFNTEIGFASSRLLNLLFALPS
jgi:hypothetical protein